MGFLEKLQWRYAVKEFDSNKKVSPANLEQILEAIRYAPSSRGLQPFHVYVIEDLNLRKKIKTHSAEQAQIDTCTYLLVFCTRTNLDRADDYINLVSGGDETKLEALKDLQKATRNTLEKRSPEELLAWAARQTYIALGFGLAACAELNIDSCPMEGFSNKEIDKLLAMPPYMRSLAYLTIGYRKEDPKRPKIRFPKKDLFTNL